MSNKSIESVGKLLLHAEKKIASQGWDQPPMLMTIELIPGKSIGLVPIPVDIQNPAAEFIDFLAHKFLETPEATSQLASPTFYGVAFTCEAWMRYQTGEELEEVRRSRKSLADMPDSMECRTINAIDILGRCYLASRVRGESATLQSDVDLTGLAGHLYESLRIMTLSIARHLPDNEKYVEALEMMLVPSVDDALAADRLRRDHPASNG